MRIILRSFLMLSLFLSASLSHGHALQDLKKTWSDIMITTKIKTKFTKDRQINPLKFSVSTQSGVVTLTGNAKNRATFVKALRLVANTKGVRSVDTTAFDIKSVNSSFKDAYITAKVEAAILESKVFDDESIPLVGINASTTNGIVSLTGTVKHQRSIAMMLKRAHHVHGVRKIRSHLTVA
ncbi:MAG: BON domain-containing protein [Gammaproteobacteria bacterium]|nr:BON domain-containing protein [Gammaproteobacteria bacterium]